MTCGVVEKVAIVTREGNHTLGIETVVVTDRPLVAQVNVRAMAGIVQSMLTGGRAALEDGEWVRAQVQAVQLAPHEHAALEALRTRLQSGTALLREASTTTWY